MKRILVLLLVISSLLVFAGCFGTTTTNKGDVLESKQVNSTDTQKDANGAPQGDVENQNNVAQQNDNTQKGNVGEQNNAVKKNDAAQQKQMTPESKLSMKVSMLGRINKSENPLTKEQKAKLLPILKEISAKATVDEQYFTKKIAEIEAILTAAQKTAAAKKPDGNMVPGKRGTPPTGNTATQGAGTAPTGNAPTQGNETPPAGNVAAQGTGTPPTGNMAPPNGRGENETLKSVCDRMITMLQQ